MAEPRNITMGGHPAGIVLTGGLAHLPECADAQHIDGAGGRMDSLERASSLGFGPCPLCLPVAEPEPTAIRRTRKGKKTDG